MSRRERQLRALLLALMVPVAATIIGGVLFIAGPTAGWAGVLVTLLFGLFSVYNHYFELPEDVSDTVHEVELDESATAGTRPDSSEPGFNIDSDDLVLSELPPKRVAQVIYNSPNWHPDGHGGHSTWWRTRLRRLSHSDVFSSRMFEFTIFGLTMLAFILLYFIFLSFMPSQFTLGFLEPLTDIYPSSPPIEQTQVLVIVSFVVLFTGLAYFRLKLNSTCPVCNSPFALQSKKRYFKPENREAITTTENGNTEKIEVTYGVHIFHCESCGSWNVLSEKWEQSLESQRL